MNYSKQKDKWAQRRAKLRELHAKGWPVRRIAESEGLTTQRVYAIIKADNNGTCKESS